jgi:hypothetical protein
MSTSSSSATISHFGVGAGSSTANRPSIPALRLDFKRGAVSGLQIGDSIAKALTYIQMNFQVFGRLEIVASLDDLTQPIHIILTESGEFPLTLLHLLQ